VIAAAIGLLAGVSSLVAQEPAKLTPEQIRSIRPPRIVNRVNAVYPPELVRSRIEGLGRLTATIEPDGSVSNIKVVRSLHRSSTNRP
jgi:outer membrane biosynthesis protein TonB